MLEVRTDVVHRANLNMYSTKNTDYHHEEVVFPEKNSLSTRMLNPQIGELLGPCVTKM